MTFEKSSWVVVDVSWIAFEKYLERIALWLVEGTGPLQMTVIVLGKGEGAWQLSGMGWSSSPAPVPSVRDLVRWRDATPPLLHASDGRVRLRACSLCCSIIVFGYLEEFKRLVVWSIMTRKR